MNAHIKDELSGLGSQFEDLLTLLTLPNVKFDQIYPQLKVELNNTFTSNRFQQEIIDNIKNRDISKEDLDAEKAEFMSLLDEIKADDSLSESKKDFVNSILTQSIMTIYDLVENPREKIEVKIKVLPGGKIPTYAHPTDAGADVYASEPTNFEPYETKIVHTAIQVAIPTGYEIQLRPRSGLSLKTGFRVANAPGTIDSDYRGTVGVIMTNTSDKPATIEKGDKIAQMVISPVPMIKWVETDNLDETERGENGFGSTDKD